MNSLYNVIRQRATYEKICDFKTNGSLHFPREDINGSLYVVSQSGEIFNFSEGTSDHLHTMNGQPSCICFDAYGGIYITETFSASLYYKTQCTIQIYILFFI
jgi:hypothetical protein